MSSLTFFQAQKWAFSFVAKSGGEESAIELLLKGLRKWNTLELLCHYNDYLTPQEVTQFKKWVSYYEKGWPVQYLLGEATFFGRDFKVNEHTLIPRQETEELVEWILADFPEKEVSLKVADIGTGTGAIGISLKKERPNWDVSLTDISAAALKMARQNADMLESKVSIFQGDLFAPLKEQYRIIVSNPPYIAPKERDLMDKTVLEHEPASALFAPEDGLLFYNRFANEVKPFLDKGARLYLEIGFKQGKAVKQIFLGKFPAAEVIVKKDITGNERMVRVEF
ncbi:peptide chain release factor N(5)-glutamine methyltransferase [Liquorilactobacillus oeni]|uniref:Release factor glutamine methyltransferase n=1 Tax=Liquorilactobacillus oeni DSM 19972 TaxID=1423777 RepID=A0A0R1M7N2_9LACO|nr:peptide chain release factor N(5)-glutamine methyltransferase [Liquorilactobacillus oeni]KRL04159.1 peptide release factor-glutamine N5-methyltransferase [Liquorilactobacillus oeni DSM 19972]